MKRTIEYMKTSGMIKNLQSSLNLVVKDAGKYDETSKKAFRNAFHSIMMHELSEDDEMLEIFMKEAIDTVFNELDFKPDESLSEKEQMIAHFIKFLTED